MGPQESDEQAKAHLEAAYDKFVEGVRDLFHAGQGRSRQAVEMAMDAVRARMAAAGEFTAEQGERFKRYLMRDLAHAQEQSRRIGREAAERVHPERLRAGALAALSGLLHAAGETLEAWSRKADQAILYEAGEITSAGTLTCVQCGRVLHLKKTGHVPPCPDCFGARFRKSY
ncbi:MAG: hypothetical protein HYZ19_00365 [Rhodocyclales bacterium]|nr:hypothetical protein [Rhodocyclales bacterium]